MKEEIIKRTLNFLIYNCCSKFKDKTFQTSKTLFSLILIICINSCDLKKENKPPIKILIPENLIFKTLNQKVILNTVLFNKYYLETGDSAISNLNLKSRFTINSDSFILNLKKSEFEELAPVSGKDSLKFYIHFQCKNCVDAFVFCDKSNSKNLILDSTLQKYLNDPVSVRQKLDKKGNTFSKYFVKNLQNSDYQGMYLILRDINNKIFIYELAAINSDASSPFFYNNLNNCRKKINETEGVVCLVIRQFEGYFAPIQGCIYGDVDSLFIGGYNIKFEKGDFFQTLYLKTIIGYNQIPIVIKDKFGNKTKTYIELTMNRIERNNPSINIDNNVNIR
jgi:hypothetical protein